MRAGSAGHRSCRKGFQGDEVALFLSAACLESADQDTSKESDHHGGGGDAGAGQQVYPGKEGGKSALPTTLSDLDPRPDGAVELGAGFQIGLPTLQQGGEFVIR